MKRPDLLASIQGKGVFMCASHYALRKQVVEDASLPIAKMHCLIYSMYVYVNTYMCIYNDVYHNIIFMPMIMHILYIYHK